MNHRILLRSMGYCLSTVLLFAIATGSDALATNQHKKGKPPPQAVNNLIIQEQGAYAFGGTILGDPEMSSLHCDHGYVEYQIPQSPRDIPLLMWHSATTITWEKTFDGREGFQSIFLRRGFPVYMIDGPRIGRADWGCAEYTYAPELGRDQSQVSNWRIGQWNPPSPPEFFPGVQFPTNNADALDQFFRARYLEFETIPSAQLETDEVAKLVEDIGPVTILSHSGSGIRGWLTRLKSNKVAGIVAYEPAQFVFPTGEAPPPPLPGLDNPEVPLAEFQRLTQIPIQIVFGDNLDKVPFWAAIFANAQAFVQAVNDHGGDAQLLHLPEIGIFGNTHFPMSDLNNQKTADLLSAFLKRKGLDKRGRNHYGDDDGHKDKDRDKNRFSYRDRQ